MPNSEVDDFLKDISKDESDPFTPAMPQKPESDAGTGGKSEEGDETLPFHKDPKVQRYIDKEIERRAREIKPTEIIREVPAKKEESAVSELRDVLVRIIGNDTPEKIAAVTDLERVLGSMEEKGAQRALREIEERAEAEQAEEAAAQEELMTGFENIEQSFGVDLTSNTPAAVKMRGEFIDFIKRVSPKDGEGNVVEFPDLPEAFQVFRDSRKPEPNNKAKDLSARSLTRSADASNAPQQQDNSWRAVDKHFGKFSN